MNINNNMANKFNKFLGQMATGFFDPKGNLGDYQHAARLFVDDTFRLAPKNKFLFYVVFNVNPNALDDMSFEDRHLLELNYLVKTADLPKYTLKTETLNQYNRKTNVYTGIQYEPVSITLHDDNNGITNTLWALYYGYYFADRLNSSDPYSDVAPIAYERNAYYPKNYAPFRYGLDNDSDEPFFNSIQLFTLSRQRFFSYLLANPKITKWDHDNVDQSAGGDILENKLTIAYDAVIYNSGVVQPDDPAGFAVLHYDQSPSPIVNEEILQNGIAGIFGDLFSLNKFGSIGGALGSVVGSMAGISPYTNYGNRMPYGYGQPSFYNPYSPYSPYSTSGFQQYGFGSYNSPLGLTGTLAVAGVGLAANAIGNVIKGFGSDAGQTAPPNGSSVAEDPDKNTNTGVTAPNGEKPAAADAYQEPGFSGKSGEILSDATKKDDPPGPKPTVLNYDNVSASDDAASNQNQNQEGNGEVDPDSRTVSPPQPDPAPAAGENIYPPPSDNPMEVNGMNFSLF